MTDAEQIIEYYQNTLIAQYYRQPKAIATIGAYVGEISGDAIYTQVRDAFDLEAAIGKQLDMLGELRGVSRYLFSLDLSKTFMAVPSYDDGDKGSVLGMADYDDPVYPSSWFTMRYDDFVSYTLEDDDFRRVIQYLATLHACDYSFKTLDDLCYRFFLGNVNIVELGSYQLRYKHLTSDPDKLFSIIWQMGRLPRPAGVTVTAQEVASF